MTTAFLRKVGQISVPQATTTEIISFTESGKTAEVSSVSVPDSELVLLARSGDQRAMESLFHRHEIAVFRLAHRILHCADAADDARQETFVRVFASLPKFRQDASFKTYTLAICSNLCRDRLRTDRRRPESLYGLAPKETTGSSSDDPAKYVEREGERNRVRGVIAALAPTHREILHLRYVEELPLDEIARITECSRFAVPVRLFRARKSFEQAYRTLVSQEDGKQV